MMSASVQMITMKFSLSESRKLVVFTFRFTFLNKNDPFMTAYKARPDGNFTYLDNSANNKGF